MTKKPDIHRLLAFQKLLLEFSQIERVVDRRHTHANIKETDTEHSYNLALTAWFLAHYFPELDSDTLIRYALIHDLVEIHAGDTYIYGEQAHLDSKKQREAQALRKLQSDWPDFPELTKQITEYEKLASNEAKFVYALDKIMPIMQIFINDGYTWKQEKITPQQLDEVKRAKVALSPEITPYYEQLYDLLLATPELFG